MHRDVARAYPQSGEKDLDDHHPEEDPRDDGEQSAHALHRSGSPLRPDSAGLLRQKHAYASVPMSSASGPRTAGIRRQRADEEDRHEHNEDPPP